MPSSRAKAQPYLVLCLLLVILLTLDVAQAVARPLVELDDPREAERLLAESRSSFGSNDTWVVLIYDSSDVSQVERHLPVFEDVVTSEEEDNQLPQEHRYAILPLHPAGTATGSSAVEQSKQVHELAKKWLIFSTPQLAFVSDAGKELYFVPATGISDDRDRLVSLLRGNSWMSFARRWSGWASPSSRFYPWLVYLSPLLRGYYALPPWVILIGSLAVSQLIRRSLQSDNRPSTARPAVPAAEPAPAAANADKKTQ